MKNISDELRGCILAAVYAGVFLSFSIQLFYAGRVSEFTEFVQQFLYSIGGL